LKFVYAVSVAKRVQCITCCSLTTTNQV